jgi:Pyridoxamine 5'-phosphate oxidase
VRNPDGNNVEAVRHASGWMAVLRVEMSIGPVFARRMRKTDTMTEPISTRNLDRYGSVELPWSRPRGILVNDTPEADMTFFVATVRADGRPHSAGVGGAWVDDALYFTSGPGTQKSRNLAANPACTVSVRMRGIEVGLEGEAYRVTDPATLGRLAAVYRSGGWPAEVEGDAFTAPFSAPSAGPPPWHLYRLTLQAAVGVATTEPFGATHWEFAA